MPHPSSNSDASTFKILITTDNHIGFAERDPRRGDDSFTTFEEVLRAARAEHEVDFALLGGDLFHENKPSLGCLVRTSSLLRKYVLGDRPILFSLLSDPAKNFPTHALPLANFQDPNLNVALPLFAIHGNHDDPVGGTSALDILSTSGYLNYFGHVSSLENIVVEPILLQKGNTFIALYGLGNVRDERLHRCFRHKKVHFVHPKPVPGRTWFKIFLLHQNRGVRGVFSKGGIYENMLSGFGFDLVIWGNEHEQLMVPQPSQGFDIVQPGSTILTSLSKQECNPKQYGILEVRNASYRLTPFMLRSVRPVVLRTVVLAQDNPKGRTLDAVEEFLRSVVEEMLSEAEEQISHIPDDILTFHPNLKFPLMRLLVDFTDVESAPFPQPNLNRFGQQYIDVVANPGELLRPIKAKPMPSTSGGGYLSTTCDGEGLGALVVPVAPQLGVLDIRAKVAEVFNHSAKDACSLLSEPEVSAAVYAFAEKGERDAIDERIMELLNTSQKMVWRKLGNGDSDAILKPDVITMEVEKHKWEMNQRYARTLRTEAEEKEDAAAYDAATGQSQKISGPHQTEGGPSAVEEEGMDEEDFEEQREREQRRRHELFNTATTTTTAKGAVACVFDSEARDWLIQSKQINARGKAHNLGRSGVEQAQLPRDSHRGPMPFGEPLAPTEATDHLEGLPSDGLDCHPMQADVAARRSLESFSVDRFNPAVFPPARVTDASQFGLAATKRPRSGGSERAGGRGRGGSTAGVYAEDVVNVSDDDDDMSQPGITRAAAQRGGRSMSAKGTMPKKSDKGGALGSNKTSTAHRGGGRRGGASAEVEQQSKPRRKGSAATAAEATSLGRPVLNLVYNSTATGTDAGVGGVPLARMPSSQTSGASALTNATEQPVLNLLSKWRS